MENITEKIISLKDEKYKEFISKLLPTINSDRVIGVKTPILRKLAKELLLSGDYKNFISTLPHLYFEENLLHALIINEIKSTEEVISYLESFLPFVDNWAVCDAIRPKAFKKAPPSILNFAKKNIDTGLEFSIRFGIELLMVYFLDDKFEKEHLDIVASVKSEYYYVNMMISWYFATALFKKWDEAIIFIEKEKLNKWCHNKTIQKAIESYRLSNCQKEYLRLKKIK